MIISLLRLVVCSSLILVLSLSLPAAAKSDGELVGKFLEEDKSAGIGALVEGMANGGESVSDQDAVTGLFASLVGGDKIKSIKVEVAEPGRLVLLVQYRNFQNYELVTRAVGSSGSSVDDYIPPVTIDPGNKKGQVNVELLMPSAGQNSLQTALIRFEARPKSGQSGSAWTYKLKKNWGTGPAIATGSGPVASGGPEISVGNGQEPPAYPGSYPGQSSDYVGQVIDVTPVGVNEETRNLRKSENSTKKSIPKTKAIITGTMASGNRSSEVTVKPLGSNTATFGQLAISQQVYLQQPPQIKVGEQWLNISGCVVTMKRTGKSTNCNEAAKAAYRKRPDAQYLDSDKCVVTKKAVIAFGPSIPKRDCSSGAKTAYNERALNGPQPTRKNEVVYAERGKDTSKDKKPQGPSGATINLLAYAVVSVPGMKPWDIIPFHYFIYQDANPDSGIFYYLPTAYHLKWDTDRGHGLDINLGAQGGSAGNDTVSISATLDSGLDLENTIIANSLADAYIDHESKSIFKTNLEAMIVGVTPTTSLKEDLQVNSIEASNISVNSRADIFRDMSVAWTSDAVTKANIYQLLQNDNGISSQLTFQVGEGESGVEVGVPISIALANSETFGQISFDRKKGWKNETPYPVKLKYVHALILEDNVPVVYSWELGDATLQPKDSVEWNASNIPTWVDQKALRLWTEYFVDNTCDPCSQRVLEDVEKGVIIRTHQVLIDPMNSLERLGAYEIGVQIRSRYINPSPTQIPEYLPWARLRENGEEVNAGMLHLGGRSLGEEVPGDPLMAYRVVVIMDGTGQRHEGQNWIPLNDTRLILGTSQIEASLGYLPE